MKIHRPRPALQRVTCEDEEQQTAFVVRTISAHREQGISLKQQAVLSLASHHAIDLIAETLDPGARQSGFVPRVMDPD